MDRLRSPLARDVGRWAGIVAIAVSMVSPALAADASKQPPLYSVFATCLGRLSAEMEHQWLMRDPAADLTEAHRSRLVSLTEAATPAGLEAKAMHIRLETKFAHKALLSRAAFNTNTEDADWAASKAAHETARCVGMLLG